MQPRQALPVKRGTREGAGGPRRLPSAGRVHKDRQDRLSASPRSNRSAEPLPGGGTILEVIGAEAVGGRTRPVDMLAIQEVHRQDTTTQAVVDILPYALWGLGIARVQSSLI
jgi:hypothetical protein